MLKHCAIGVMSLALAVPAFAGTVSFYGGDFDPTNPNANGLANETDTTIPGTPGASAYEPFVVPAGGWTVTGLFSNDLIGFSSLTDAYWEIRSGVSEGNGGTLLYSGTDTSATQTDLSLSDFGLEAYTVEVDGLNIFLPQGTYWMSVTPESPSDGGRTYNANTFGLNSVGTLDSNQAFFNSVFFSANFTNANNEGVFQDFSDGVITGDSAVPEPGSVTMVLGGAALLWAGRRRRRA